MTPSAAPSVVAPTTDPFTATVPGRRYDLYAELARSGPVHRITLPTGLSAWLLTGYDEVRQALSDPRLVKGPMSSDPLAAHLPPEIRAATGSLIVYRNPPDHGRLRRLIGAVFTRQRVERLAPRIQRLADSLLDTLADYGETELIGTYAYPLPMTVICELLGVPDTDRTDFRRWSDAFVAGTFAGVDAYVTGCSEMVGYIRRLLAEKRAEPTDDLLSGLIAVRDGGDQLTEDELVGMAMVLVIAGHETTVNLIANGVHTLLTHPGQLELLRAEPDRLPAAVEELLRFAPPVQVTPPYITTEPVCFGGTTIPAGELVVPGLLAANRDPARMTDPDQLDITRNGSRGGHHLAFGHGIHFCVGAPLARLEGKIAIGTLLARFPRLRLAVPADQLTWAPHLLMHGLSTLPVALR